MRRAVSLWLLTLALTACNQRSNADTRLADADAQERARQEKVAKDMVSRTEDQVRVKMLEQRVAALEAQVAAMQGDRKLLDAQLVEQRLNQIEAGRVDTPSPSPSATPTPTLSGPKDRASSAAPKPAATPPARKPLVLDLR
ncbi:hypothetical protein [uncultured Sphingomonas sp.]|uniref:hypothetical protein n=1 Tax=uncultured Sphingomonas sp. TaxID=158754 RepID=UPI001F94AEAF|nr:hypothetical protein [uncultured Sphingomonas sp.]HIV76636.1 hypothetical protein [Candidatus Sphingomonas excrementigallinarum]